MYIHFKVPCMYHCTALHCTALHCTDHLFTELLSVSEVQMHLRFYKKNIVSHCPLDSI